MNSYSFMFISAYSILIPFSLGVWKFRHLSSTLYPFIFFIFLNTANEFLASFLLHNHYTTSVNYNIYYLLEALILTCQFRKWGIFGNKRLFFCLTVLLFVSVWIIESFITKVYLTLNSYYIIFYSFILVMMSIKAICMCNKDDHSDILFRPMFIICCTFILFYSNTIVIDTFSAYSLKTSKAFRWRMLNILHFINIVCNFLYFFAILQLPKKQRLSIG
jgi:hypothetical protein